MSGKYKFIWIDDDPQREITKENLKEILGVNISFINIKGKVDVIETVLNLLKKAKPDLFLIDHRLDRNYYRNINGPGVTEIIRQKWSDIPIICITAANFSDIDLHSKEVYDDVFKHGSVIENSSLIISLAKHYKTLRKNLPKNSDEILQLLKAPDVENENIEVIIPKELKYPLPHPLLCKSISDWIRKEFMAKPGFLINKNWAATICGLKFDSFVKIENKFSKALYKGLFCNDCQKRWWKSLIITKIFSTFKSEQSIYPWIVARHFKEVKALDYSKCYVCGKDYPEIVGYTDLEAKTQVQLHISCSVPHPRFEKSLYFEEIRMAKEKE